MPFRLAIANVLLSAGHALADKPHYEIAGKVVAIADGDTRAILDDAKLQYKIRLHGIDTPEKSQAFGTRARENLAAKVFGKTVRVDVVDVDRYTARSGESTSATASSIWRWFATASRGVMCTSTSRASSPTRNARRERNAAACGRTQIPSRPGNTGAKDGRQRRVDYKSGAQELS